MPFLGNSKKEKHAERTKRNNKLASLFSITHPPLPSLNKQTGIQHTLRVCVIMDRLARLQPIYGVKASSASSSSSSSDPPAPTPSRAHHHHPPAAAAAPASAALVPLHLKPDPILAWRHITTMAPDPALGSAPLRRKHPAVPTPTSRKVPFYRTGCSERATCKDSAAARDSARATLSQQFKQLALVSSS